MSKVRRALARRHVAFLAPHEKSFASAYSNTMKRMRADVGNRGISARDLAKWKDRTWQAMQPEYRSALVAGGRDFLRSSRILVTTAKGILKATGTADVIARLEALFKARLTETIDVTAQAIDEVLTEAAADSLDQSEIDDLINDEWSDVFSDRSGRISVVEVNGAVNSVRDYLMRELVEMQAWISALDDRVRPTHVIYDEAGDKPVGFDWASMIEGADYHLRYPCDPECDEASEVVNCRCFTAPTAVLDMTPAEAEDYLAEFGMSLEDLQLSEEQVPKGFDPNEDRDEQGRWTSTGAVNDSLGSGSGASLEALRRTAAMRARGRRHVRVSPSGEVVPSTEDGGINLPRGWAFAMQTPHGLDLLDGNSVALARAQKAFSEEDHPRVPAGSPDGGEFTDGSGGGGEKPSLTEVGRALSGSPAGFNFNPAEYKAIPFGKTQTGEKLEAAVAKEMDKLANPLTLPGGDGKPEIKLPGISAKEMGDNLDKLYSEASDAEKAHGAWYSKEAGQVVRDFHAQFKDRIPGLGLDTVSGILAAASANNVWDDKFGTPDQLATSNQVVAQRVLEAWADNKDVKITPDELAMAQRYIDTQKRVNEETGKATYGMFTDIKLPEVGTHSFRDLAQLDPRSAFLFYTTWAGSTINPKTGKPEKSPDVGRFGFGGMPGHVLPGLELLMGHAPGDVYGGESKVRSFYGNIARAVAGQKDDDATIDIWMVRALLNRPPDQPLLAGAGHYGKFIGPAPRYEGLRRIIAERAHAHGIEPKEYQAIVWYVLRNRYDSYFKGKSQQLELEDLKDIAKGAKMSARQLAKRTRLPKKGYTPEDSGPAFDEQALFTWLARFLAHERGDDVSGDPLFGPWDAQDEAAADAWRGTVKSARVVGDKLLFLLA